MQVLFSGNVYDVSRGQGKEKHVPILLKWPGGKRAILKHILPFAPETFRHYYEPFIGSGALFFTLTPVHASISDSNKELTNCYTQVRDHPQAIIETLAMMKNTQENYYRVRESSPTDPIDRAARFIYLMTLSFNGLHRVNLQGKFNVPYNHKTHINPCDRDKILKVSLALTHTSITNCDFEKAIEGATAGDFIYFDPPYTVSSGPRRFIKYNDNVFSWEDQIRLARVAHRLASHGCHVLISNATHPDILELYQDYGFRVHTITRLSVVAADSKHRGKTSECLFYNKEEGAC